MGDSVLEPGVLSPSTGPYIENPCVTMETEGGSSVRELMPPAGIFELLALMEGGKGRGMEGGREAEGDTVYDLGFHSGHSLWGSSNVYTENLAG